MIKQDNSIGIFTQKVKPNIIVLWTIFLLLLFLSGFRWDVGIDWENYMSALNPETTHLSRMEPIVKFIVNILWANNFYDPGYTLFIMAFLILFFFFYSIRCYSYAPIFSVLLFICLGPFFDSLNGVRQYVAIALFVFSWQYLYTKQPISYFVTILCAAGFHKSALLMIPVYFIIHHKFNRNFLIIAFCVSISLMFFISPILIRIASLLPFYSNYSRSNFILSNTNLLSLLRVLFPSIIFVFCILMYDKLKKDNIVILNLSLIYIFLTILFPNVQLVIRVAFYFQAAILFLIPIINKQLSKKNALILDVFIVTYGITFIYITQINRPVSKIIPYNLDFRLANIKLFLLLFFVFIFCFLFVKIIPKLFCKKLVWKTSRL